MDHESFDHFIRACALLAESADQAKEAAENRGTWEADAGVREACREMRRHIGLMLTAAGKVIEHLDEIEPHR